MLSNRRNFLGGAAGIAAVTMLPAIPLSAGPVGLVGEGPVELVGRTFVDEVVRAPAGSIVRDCRFVRSSIVFVDGADDAVTEAHGNMFEGHHLEVGAAMYFSGGSGARVTGVTILEV